VLSRIFPDKHTPQLGRLVIVPCGELFSIPLHVAAVPGDWRGEAVDRQIPLCHWKPVSFSVSLASHVLRNRAAFRSCVHQPGDDLCVLFAGEAGFRESIDGVLRSAGEWGAHGMARAPAGIEAVREVIARKPEFLVLQCHGSTLGHPQAGSVLMLHGGVLSNFGIASRQWLPRNKLTILGACVSGRPVRYGDVPADKSGNPAGDKPDDAVRPADEIAGFIRGFVAAGCGALLVTNWSVLQSELGDVTEKIVRRIGESKEVLHLDALLSEVFRSGGEAKTSFRRLVERSVFQVFL
jgi:hypothetical protein